MRWLRPTSAAVYTIRLLNPAYAAIHAAIPGAQVAGGGTAPRGSTGGVSPVAWIAGMHAAHARLDAYAHNPYPLDPKRETPLTGGCGHCTTITMATIDKLVTLVARDFGSARIWLSEYGYQSNPPDRFLGVSLALQARYMGEGAYVAYRTPRVDLLIHFLYRDEPNLARFQSGLVTLDERAEARLRGVRTPARADLAGAARERRSGVSCARRLPARPAGSSSTLRRAGGRSPPCTAAAPASSATSERSRAAPRCDCAQARSRGPAVTIE